MTPNEAAERVGVSMMTMTTWMENDDIDYVVDHEAETVTIPDEQVRELVEAPQDEVLADAKMYDGVNWLVSRLKRRINEAEASGDDDEFVRHRNALDVVVDEIEPLLEFEYGWDEWEDTDTTGGE